MHHSDATPGIGGSSTASTNFAALLSPHFRLQDLEDSSAIIFGIWADFTIAYVNPAWVKFAESNGGEPQIAQRWGVGANYLDAIAPPLRTFYTDLVESAPGVGESMHPLSHLYECSSAEEFRRFSMQVYALPERAGFIIVNSLVTATPYDSVKHPAHGPDRTLYADRDGTIVQCSHCRLVRQANDHSQWDWVPAWIAASPERTSHGLCPVCLEYYYPPQVA